MKKFVYPPREEIYNLYVAQNLSYADIMQHYNISKATFFRIIKKYNIVKDKKLSNKLREKTNMVKYGVSNISQNEEIKLTKEKTLLDHYGVSSPQKSQEIKAKTHQTNLKRYGSITPAGNSSVVQKMQKSCFEKYGAKNPSLVREFKDKRKNTNLSKYGVACNLSLLKEQERIKATNVQKYGVPYFCMTSKCRGISYGSKSAINNKVSAKLHNLGVDFEREFILDNYIYDFKINNILVEINPTYTHSVDIAYRGSKKRLDKDYHYLKSLKALENGFICLHIFDWMSLDDIISDIAGGKYNQSIMVRREIKEYWFNQKTKALVENVPEDSQQKFIADGFVRVYDDGYDIQNNFC